MGKAEPGRRLSDLLQYEEGFFRRREKNEDQFCGSDQHSHSEADGREKILFPDSFL